MANQLAQASQSSLVGVSADATRLYQKIAHQLVETIEAGGYSVGDRLPAERDLAKQFGVSRPVVREAILALEVLGLMEVRVGSGAYVTQLPGTNARPEFSVSPFELVEARKLFEGEAAALAAEHISDTEITELEALVVAIGAENARPDGKEKADEAFHMLIARATRNAAIEQQIAQLWNLRTSSPECALLQEKARIANVRPVIEEHTRIVDALRARDPKAARTAMRAHLTAVIDHLLFAIEEDAVAEARKSVETKRRRYARPVSD